LNYQRVTNLLGIGNNALITYFNIGEEINISSINFDNRLKLYNQIPATCSVSLKHPIFFKSFLNLVKFFNAFNHIGEYSTISSNGYNITKVELEEGNIYYTFLKDAFVISGNEAAIKYYTNNFNGDYIQLEDNIPLLKLDENILKTSQQIGNIISNVELFGQATQDNKIIAKGKIELKLV